MNKINHFSEHKKIRINNFSKAFIKHEVVKLIAVILIENKHKCTKIYTEFNGLNKEWKRKADIYFETKDGKYVVEVQKNMANDYQKKTELEYLDMDITPIIIPLNKISDNINKIWEELKSYI